MHKEQKCAVFSCLGLGDGLVALVLSHNLRQNGFAVTTFHPMLGGMQGWFPNLPIVPFPPIKDLETALAPFSKFYIIYEKSPWMEAILAYCQKHFPSKTIVLNPIATPHTNYPYWEGGKFDGKRPFVDNLYHFCKDILRLPKVSKSNGITAPDDLIYRRHLTRVVLHPSSSREGKNWPQDKFLTLAHLLRDSGYQPSFILTDKERVGWEGIDAPSFKTLSDVAAFVYESSYMIGNDSGIGHLASCLGLPTLTICRNRHTADFWRPAWSKGQVLVPPSFIPNIKGLRLRDKYWKNFISVRKVLSTFIRMTEELEASDSLTA